MRRYELTDEQCEQIQGVMPPNGQSGGQWREHRLVLNDVFWLLHSGAQRRELPEALWPLEDRLRPLQPPAQGLFDQILQWL